MEKDKKGQSVGEEVFGKKKYETMYGKDRIENIKKMNDTFKLRKKNNKVLS